MKKIIFSLAIVITTSFAFGQITVRDTTIKVFNNIIELNANGIFHQVLNLSGNSYYNSKYMVGYKRIFKSNALRVNLGGSVYIDNTTSNDTLKDGRKGNSLNAGIGLEHYSYLRKKWNFIHGVDIIGNYNENYYLQGNSSISSYEETQINYGIGVSPFLGLQYKINSRFSISTEASYDIIYSKSDDKRIHIPQSNYNSHSRGSVIQTAFNAPLAINFRIHL